MIPPPCARTGVADLMKRLWLFSRYTTN